MSTSSTSSADDAIHDEHEAIAPRCITTFPTRDSEGNLKGVDISTHRPFPSPLPITGLRSFAFFDINDPFDDPRTAHHDPQYVTSYLGLSNVVTPQQAVLYSEETLISHHEPTETRTSSVLDGRPFSTLLLLHSFHNRVDQSNNTIANFEASKILPHRELQSNDENWSESHSCDSRSVVAEGHRKREHDAEYLHESLFIISEAKRARVDAFGTA